MANIRPVSDLRNDFAEISRQLHKTGEPIFLTKNGHGDMVVMSIEAYRRREDQFEVYDKLKAAEIQARETDNRRSHEEVIEKRIQKLQKRITDDV